MSVITEIRNRSWLMLVVVGIALLAFLVDPQTLMNFSLGSKEKIGEVGDEEIRITEYEDLKARISEGYKNQVGITSNKINQIVWDELVNLKIIKMQAEKLGIVSIEEEILAFAAQQMGYVTQDMQPDVARLKNDLIKWKKEAGTNNESAQKLNLWESNQALMAKGVEQKKYLTLVSAGFLQNKAEIDFLYSLENDSNEISFVKIDYTKATKSNTIKISDEQIEDYIKKHPKKYTQEEGRSLDYVYLKAAPSNKDILATQNEIQSFLNGKTIYNKNQEVVEVLPPFAKSENDSAFVANYSDRVIPWEYFSANELKQAFPDPIVSFATNSAIGATSGVIRTENDGENSFSIVKLNNIKNITDSALVSHILITHIGSRVASSTTKQITKTESQAKAYADSLFAIVQKDPNAFNQLVKLSDDNGLIAGADGKLPWITRNINGLPALTNFALNNTNKKIDLIKTDLGYHIVRLEETKSKVGYRLALITKNIIVSEETENANYKKISDFYQKVNGKSRSEFSKIANQENLDFFTVDRASLYQDNLPGINNNLDEEILKWAFSNDAKVGSIKDITADNSDKIVVFLAKKSEKGLAKVEDVRSEVSEILKKQALAEQLTKQLSKLSLEQIAKKFGVEISKSSVSYSRSSNIELQNEAKVMGAAIGLDVGKKSDVIPGKIALFVVRKDTIKKQQINKNTMPFVYNQYRSVAKRDAVMNVLVSLKDFYQPIDERIKLLQYTVE